MSDDIRASVGPGTYNSAFPAEWKMTKPKPKPWDNGPLDTSGLYRMQTNANCRECGRAPAKVRLGHYSICGVCWNRIKWYHWAERVMDDHASET